MSSKILLRRGTAAQWASANPILGSGELGVETDTLKFKIGNGTSTWTQLTSYANITPSDLTSAINGLINAAPSALDTLNELAAAINNDSSFSTTVNNLLNGKVSKSGGDIITAATASTTPLTIRGAASQTADILQIQDSGGAARAIFERGGALSVQPSTALNGYTGFFKSPSSSVAGLMVRGATSQTANLQEWQNSAGTMLSKIDPSGSFYAGNSYFTSSNTYVAGTLSSSKYILGGDLSLIPVAGGQSVISSWWGLQLSGLRQSNVDYTPSNVSAANVAHVIMPLTQSAAIGLLIRGAASQTANLQEWQSSDGTVIAKVDINGSITAGTNLIVGNAAMFYTGGNYYNSTINILTQGAGYSGIVVRGQASQTADLQQWQNSSGTVVARIGSGGPIVTSSVGVFGAQSNTPNAQLFVLGNSTSNPTFVIKSAASQTANLTEWQNNSGTILSKIDVSGNITAPSYNLSDSKYLLRKTIKKTVDPAGNAIANNTYDLFDMNFSSSLQGTFYIQASIRGGGYGQNLTYSLPVTYQMDWISNYAITNPFTNGVNWVDLTPLTFSPRHLMVSDYFKFQAKVNNNQISFRIKLTGTLTNTPLFDIYIQHSEEFANCTITELSSTGTDSTTSSVMPNFLSSKFGTSTIFNPLTINSSFSSSLPLLIKAASGQTASLVEWQNSSGNVLSFIGTLGQFGTSSTVRGSSGGTFGGNTQLSSAGLTVYSTAAGNPGAIVRGVASQTADLQQWQDNTGAVLAEIMSNGSLFVNSTGTANDPITIQRASATRFKVDPYGNVFAVALTAGNVVSSIAGTTAGIYTTSASTIGLVVKGSVSQTADLQQWWDSSSNVLSKIDSSGAIYLINPTANNNSNDTPSPAINFQGNIWNSAYGNQNIKGAIKVAAYAPNANPTISKMSFLLATDNGTPAEVASFTNTGAFSNIGGLDAYGSSVIFRLRNTTPSTGEVNASPKLELMGTAWNSAQGNVPSRGYLQVNVNNTNQNPFINRLGFFLATGDNAGGWIYGADATEYLSILGNGTVGINTTIPLGTLDIRPISASNKGIVIKGATSQTANLQEWQNSAGTVLTNITSAGNLNIGSTTYDSAYASKAQISSTFYAMSSNAPIGGLYLLSSDAVAADIGGMVSFGGLYSGSSQTRWAAIGGLKDNATSNEYGGYLSLGTRTNGASGVTERMRISSVGNVLINGFTASTVGLTVKAAASQTANIFEVQNSSGYPMVYVDAYGALKAQASGMYVNSGYASGTGLVVRGYASQTANLQEWQNSAGTVLAKVQSNGVIDTSQYLNMSTSGNAGIAVDGIYRIRMTNGNTRVQSSSGIITTLTVEGVASQTADLQQWQNSSGTVLAKVDASGNINAVGLSLTSTVSGTMFSIDPTYGNITSRNGAYGYSGSASLNVGTNYTAQPAIIASGYPGQSVSTIIIKSVTSQTSNLQEWQDSTGTVKSSINASGSLELNGKDIELMNIMGAF